MAVPVCKEISDIVIQSWSVSSLRFPRMLVWTQGLRRINVQRQTLQHINHNHGFLIVSGMQLFWSFVELMSLRVLISKASITYFTQNVSWLWNFLWKKFALLHHSYGVKPMVTSEAVSRSVSAFHECATDAAYTAYKLTLTITDEQLCRCDVASALGTTWWRQLPVKSFTNKRFKITL